MKKEEIYLDLRKLSEEEIKSIPEVLETAKEETLWLLNNRVNCFIDFLEITQTEFPFLDKNNNYSHWRNSSSAPIDKTEITFQDFKNLFRDYEKEMFEMLVAVTNDYHNGLPVDIDKIEQLIKEVEAR